MAAGDSHFRGNRVPGLRLSSGAFAAGGSAGAVPAAGASGASGSPAGASGGAFAPKIRPGCRDSGGRTLDVTKFAAHMAGIPMVAVATSLAHDGIASPTASLEHESGKGSYGVPMPVAAREPAGRIAQVGRLPLDQLAAGTYELRAVVKQGTEEVSRSTILRISE